MRIQLGSPIQRTVVLTIPMIAVMWMVAVPGVLTISSFFALVGLIVAAGWIGMSAYGNGQPAASVAQLLHDTEGPSARQHRRDSR